MIEVKLLGSDVADYALLESESQDFMFYHSLKYREFLQKVLKSASAEYYLLYRDEKLRCALPVFSLKGPQGKVFNSLPFYGSHGSVVTAEECDESDVRYLIEHFNDVCKANDVFTSTVIENVLAPDAMDYIEADYVDSRIGQITEFSYEGDNLDSYLMSLFHQKTRNMVRKSLKSGFEIYIDNTEAAFKQLYDLHVENLKQIGGRYKDWEVFSSILNVFEPGVDFDLYTAKRDGIVAASMLVFYYRDMVEYFTPAINVEYRADQPLSCLIYNAMRDRVAKNKVVKWNWGGTWHSQDGVYRFKSRWGAVDTEYRYYTRLYKDPSVLSSISTDSLLSDYKNFYVLPFKALHESD